MNPPDAFARRAVRAIVAACGLPAALLTVGIWLAFLLGHLGGSAWLFDLFANFRVQYLGLFASCTIALTIARWRKTALLALLGVAATTASMSSYFDERVAPPPTSARFRLVTMNVWFRNDDLSRIVEFLERSRADVIVLQEVEARRLEALRAALRSYPHHVATQKARRGLVILSRTPLSGIEHFALPGRVTRIIRASVRWQGQDIAIVGTHLSWPISPGSARQRAAELRLIAQRVRREAGPVLVAGDMNMTPWSRYFERFLDQSRLGDCAHGRGLLATWPAQVPPLRIRIDHCFASPHWTVRAIDVGPQLGSDHLPVTVDLEFARRD